MATTIKLKTGSGAPLNTDLVQGEPAIDLTNKRLYTEDGTDTVIEIGTNPTEVTTGDLTATGTVDLSSATVSNGGTVTTVDIDGGTVDGTVVGGTTAAAGTFTDLTANTSLTAATADINGGTVDDTAIGATTASTGAFTTLSASTSLTAAGLAYPTTDGTADQVLVTNGTGTLSFADAAGGVAGVVSSANATAMTINSSEQIGIGLTPSTTYSDKLQVSNGVRLNNTGADFVAGESGGFFGHYDDLSFPGSTITTSYATFCKSYSAVNQIGNATSGDVVLASGSASGGYAPDFFTGNAYSGDVEIYTGSVASYGGVASAGTIKIQDQTSKGTIIERDGDVTMKADIIVMSNLPTSDPVNAGQLWNDSGTLKVSAG